MIGARSLPRSTRPNAAPPRRTRLLLAGVALVLSGAAAGFASADGAKAPTWSAIRVVDFPDEIEAALAAYTERRLAVAKDAGDDCVVLRIDSPGGTVHHSMEIADAILALPKSVHTIAWVEERAFSGAAMVALACDEIVMGPKGVIGDCQPILMSGEGFVPAGEKVETVLRAQFRKYAEDNGWPRLLAEKMVSKDMEVIRVRDERDGTLLLADGQEFLSARDTDLVSGVPKASLTRLGVVVGKDRLLTLTTSEAKELGFVRRVFPSEKDLLAAISAPNARVTFDAMTFSESTGRWLLGFVGALGAIVLLCATLTMFRGFGTATFVGVGALLLLLLVTWTADLENGLAFLLVGAGGVLLLAEAFVIPGFGVAGILGIALTAAGFLFLATGFGFESKGTLTWTTARDFLLQTVLTMGAGIGALLVLARVFPGVPFFGRAMLLSGDALVSGAAVPPATWTPVAGGEGTAATALRPAGRAVLSGRGVDVTSEGGFVEAGTRVRVVRVEGSRVVVRPVAPLPGGGSPS